MRIKEGSILGMNTTCAHIPLARTQKPHRTIIGRQVSSCVPRKKRGQILEDTSGLCPKVPQLREVKTGTGFPDFSRISLCSQTKGPVCSGLACQLTAFARPSHSSREYRGSDGHIIMHSGGVDSHRIRAMVCEQ